MPEQRTHPTGGRGSGHPPPTSPSYEGRYGRMFRKLPAADTPREYLEEIAVRMREQTLDGWSGGALPADNAAIPAAYTYFGQFVDHDITFDPASSLQRANDPDALVNFRSPRLDLDSLYGRGPDDEPYLYDRDSPGSMKLVVGAVAGPDGALSSEPDLQRNRQERAVIGDPRNDENTIVSQLYVGLVGFHNRICDDVAGEHALLADPSPEQRAVAFREVQRRVRWHYQWVVVEDYLRRTIGDELHGRLLPPGGDGPRLRQYRAKKHPYLPVEFSVAAFRFGHTQVRERYDLNSNVLDRPVFMPGDAAGPLDDLRGFRALPGGWSVSWPLFLPLDAAAPQLSRPIDTLLSPSLFDLPGEHAANPMQQSLAARNLMRGRQFSLPSGQDVARAIREEPLTVDQLGLQGRPAPLWFYVLKEAEVLHAGAHLGPVGGTIVGETLLGLMANDPLSYLSVRPGWTPEFPPSPVSGRFDLAALLSHADPNAGVRR